MNMSAAFLQMPLDEESQYLTTFICPEGKFQWTILPMGLNASMDIFNESMHQRLKDFCGLKNFIREVDDLLIHNTTLEELVKQLDAFFDFCQLYNITLAPKKLQFASDKESAVFAGFNISSERFSQNPGRMDSIRMFETPETKSQLKSWLGLTAQVFLWHPEVSQGQSQMRRLLRNDTAWLWTQDMENELKAMRKMLCSKKYVKPFDTSLTPNILVDTSKIYGSGYLIYQVTASGQVNLIKCGSVSARPNWFRMSPLELETCKIIWALNHCNYYLRGVT
jgi:hypothetical protein